MLSSNLDLHLLLELNSMVPHNALGYKIVNSMGSNSLNSLYRGFPVFFYMVVLWFSREDHKRRSRMLIGLLATCLAIVMSLWMQYHLATHIRPFLDPSLHLLGINPNNTLGWNHLNSFPSDSATLFFSLATVIFLESRIAGGIAFLWSLVTIGIARVATGWHYPSDIAGGLLLGIACVYLLTRIRPLSSFFERLLLRYQPRMYIVHALVFFWLAEAYTLFSGLRGLYNGFVMICGYLVARL